MSATKHRRKPYMPDSDSGKKSWMAQFIKTLESDPERFGFDDPRMFEYVQRTIRTFIKKMDEAGSPLTRSPMATVAKNDARKAAVNLCRDIAMRLKWDPTLTIEEKMALGLCAEDASAQKAKLPVGALPGSAGFPQLIVVSSPSGGHVIRYRDPCGGDAKAKPRGVSHFMLYAAIGDKPNMRKTHARLLGAFTKRRFEIMYPMACGLEGMYATYYGRWLTTRGEMSPWSKPVSKMIADTQVRLEECPFAHLFEKTGFIDAVPQLPVDVERQAALDEMRVLEDERPLLGQGAVRDALGLFAELEAKMLGATATRMLDAA